MAFSQAILEILGATNLPTIKMQRFPYPAWFHDEMSVILSQVLGLLLVMSFCFTASMLSKSITLEKEQQIKEIMKIMGLPNWLHWTAWFLKSIIFLLITIIIMTVLLTVNWIPGKKSCLFSSSNIFLIFIFFLIYICTLITFCFLVSAFFSSARTAAIVGGFVFFLTYLPFMSFGEMNYSMKLIVNLLSNTALCVGLDIIAKNEGTEEGAQFNNIWKKASADSDVTLGIVMLIMLLDSFLYMLIALYIEGIMPGQYGVRKPWYFLFTSLLKFRRKKNSGIDELDDDDEDDIDTFEKEPTGLRIGIKIKNLKKTYGHNPVVKGVSLNIYEDQITALVGHNGAGKTTIMSMLTGITNPTSGTAFVNGYNIRTDMSKVRDSLGLCPQHNVLFDELTVEQHIYFFSRLKGVSSSQTTAEIKKYVELLDLTPKVPTLPSQ